MHNTVSQNAHPCAAFPFQFGGLRAALLLLFAFFALVPAARPASADDTTPPTVTNISATPTGTYGAGYDLPTVTFKATVTDPGPGASGVNPSTVQVLIAEYRPELHSIVYATLSNGGSGNVYTGTYDLNATYGRNDDDANHVFKFYFSAKDNAGNQGNGDTVPFLTQYYDDIPPKFTNEVVTPVTVGTAGTVVALSVNIVDTGPHASGVNTTSYAPSVDVLANGGIQPNTANLTQGSGSLFTGSYNLNSNAGNAAPILWTFTFMARDDALNYATVNRYVEQDGTGTQPLPTLTSVSPLSAFTNVTTAMTLIGSGFTQYSVVLFNGFVVPATYVSATKLTCSVDKSFLPAAAQVQVKVYNPDGGGKSSGLTFTIKPRLVTLVLTPKAVTGGTSATGTVTLAHAAFADQTVTLSSSNTAVATVPATVVIPMGSSSATFPVDTTTVTTATPVKIKAVLGPTTLTLTLTVNPASSIASDGSSSVTTDGEDAP